MGYMGDWFGDHRIYFDVFPPILDLGTVSFGRKMNMKRTLEFLGSLWTVAALLRAWAR